MSISNRYRPEDDCPLFSERLEELLVLITRGESPNAGRFCGNCYHPLGPTTAICLHCQTNTNEHIPVKSIPDEIVEMLRNQRKTESRIVNGFAYLGLIIAIFGGLALVLGIPYFRSNLISATIAYALILLIGGRILAGVIGGYYGDRIGYSRARQKLREDWETWAAKRKTK